MIVQSDKKSGVTNPGFHEVRAIRDYPAHDLTIANHPVGSI